MSAKLLLFKWVLSAMMFLAPGRDHSVLATATVNVIDANDPLFKGDVTKQKTASLVTSVLFREGSLRLGIKGDKDKGGNFTSFCSMQINLPFGAKTIEGWTGEDLAEDPEKCVTVGLRMLRESTRMCPKYPVAFYAEGRDLQTCDSVRAQRISNDRMFLAARLVKKVEWVEDGSPESTLRDVPGRVYASGLSR